MMSSRQIHLYPDTYGERPIRATHVADKGTAWVELDIAPTETVTVFLHSEALRAFAAELLQAAEAIAPVELKKRRHAEAAEVIV